MENLPLPNKAIWLIDTGISEYLRHINGIKLIKKKFKPILINNLNIKKNKNIIINKRELGVENSYEMIIFISTHIKESMDVILDNIIYYYKRIFELKKKNRFNIFILTTLSEYGHNDINISHNDKEREAMTSYDDMINYILSYLDNIIDINIEINIEINYFPNGNYYSILPLIINNEFHQFNEDINNNISLYITSNVSSSQCFTLDIIIDEKNDQNENIKNEEENFENENINSISTLNTETNKNIKEDIDNIRSNYNDDNDSDDSNDDILLLNELKKRNKLKYFTHSLASLLLYELNLNVLNSTYSIGQTADLLSNSLFISLHNELKHVKFNLNDASLFIIDRTIDLKTPLSCYGSNNLFDRLINVLPKQGIFTNDTVSPSLNSSHLHQITLNYSTSSPSYSYNINNQEQEQEEHEQKEQQQEEIENKNISIYLNTKPYPAINNLFYKIPPSIIYLPDLYIRNQEKSLKLHYMIRNLFFLSEKESHSYICSILKELIELNNCQLPPKKKRGPGAEIFSLISSLINQNKNKKQLLYSSNTSKIVHLTRNELSIAYAIMESLQRTAPSFNSQWTELMTLQKILKENFLIIIETIEENESNEDILDRSLEVLYETIESIYNDLLTNQNNNNNNNNNNKKKKSCLNSKDIFLLMVYYCSLIGHYLLIQINYKIILENRLKDLLININNINNFNINNNDNFINDLIDYLFNILIYPSLLIKGYDSNNISIVYKNNKTFIGYILSNLLINNNNDNILPYIKQVKNTKQRLIQSGLSLINTGFDLLGLKNKTNLNNNKKKNQINFNKNIIVFVYIGGITGLELMEISNIKKNNPDCKIIIISNTISTSDYIIDQILCS